MVVQGEPGEWPPLAPNSCICCGSLKDAGTSLASFLQSSIPGTVDSSVHHSGVSHLLAFHGTHWLNSKTVGSGGVSSPSSLEVSGQPSQDRRLPAGFSSGSSSKSEPLPLDPCSLGPVFRFGEAAGGRLIFKPNMATPPLLLLSTSSLVVPTLGSHP